MTDEAIFDVKDLGSVGEEIGKGGQASVFELPDLAGDPLLLKRYFSHVKINDDGLDALVSWRLDLEEGPRQYLDARTCWPRARVIENDQTVGVLIGRAPDDFVTTLKSGKKKLRELQYLFLIDRSTKIGVHIPDAHGRAEVIREFAELLAFFDQHDIVHGDLSMKNVLWADPGTHDPSLYLLDCDGARVGDSSSPLPHVTTPGWTDPRMVQAEISSPDADSDRYALGLSFYRCYYGQLGELDAESTKLRLPTWPPVTPDMMKLTARTLSHRPGRPSLADWLAALDDLHVQLASDTSELGSLYRAGPTTPNEDRPTSAPKTDQPDTDQKRSTPAPPPTSTASDPNQASTSSASAAPSPTPAPSSAGNGAKIFFALSVGLLIGALIALIIASNNASNEPAPVVDEESSMALVFELSFPPTEVFHAAAF